MHRQTPDREQVAAVVDLFRLGDGQTLLDEPGFEGDLAVALRVTLQVGLILDAVGDNPTNAHEQIDFVRGDIGSAIDFFQHVEAIAWNISRIPVTVWPWPSSLSWQDVRAAYSQGLATLSSPATALPERYATLVRLIRLQLALWALTFGVTANAYIG